MWGQGLVSSFISYVSVGKTLNPSEAAFPHGNIAGSPEKPLFIPGFIHLLTPSSAVHECLLCVAQCQVLGIEGRAGMCG